MVFPAVRSCVVALTVRGVCVPSVLVQAAEWIGGSGDRAPRPEQINGLTYGAISDADREASRASWNYTDVAMSAVVLVLITAAYLYFQG